MSESLVLIDERSADPDDAQSGRQAQQQLSIALMDPSDWRFWTRRKIQIDVPSCSARRGQAFARGWI